MVPIQRFFLGIDIGGTSTKVGLVTETGQLNRFDQMPTLAAGSDPEPFLSRLDQIIKQTITEDGLPNGIGVSMHGMLNESGSGAAICNNTPALRGFDLRTYLQERYGLPTVIFNDLTAHALAEYHFGAGRGAKRFLCLALGTGVGAGAIIDGKPLSFLGGRAGDTGRLILDPDGHADLYGVKGSAEALCGTTGIERLAQREYGYAVSAHQVISAARVSADPVAMRVMAQIGRWVGQLLASLSAVFLPDRIALTGGTTEAGAVLLEASRQEFERLCGEYHRIFMQLMPDSYAGVEIVLGTGRVESGVIGAVAGFITTVHEP